MAARNVTENNITTYLFNVLDSNVEDICVAWRAYLADTRDAPIGTKYKVYKDLQEQLPYTPAVEIVFRTKTNEIRMVGTQEEVFNYDLIVTVNNQHAEMAAKFLAIVADAIEMFLNDFQRRGFEIPDLDGKCAYFSQAGPTDYGFRRGQGVRSAKIPWLCKLFKPERHY
jgi:hypothetical protein